MRLQFMPAKHLALGLVIFGLALNLHATPMRYDFQAVESGSLGSAVFSNALLDFSLVADTASVTTTPPPPLFSSPNIFWIPQARGTVTIAGLGTANLTSNFYLFDSHYNSDTGAAGFGLINTSNAMDVLYVAASDAGLQTYKLNGSIGPVSGYLTYGSGSPLGPLGTSSGNLNISSVGNFTFAASVAPNSPLLSIKTMGTNVILSWPTNVAGLTLQFATNLNPPAVWTNASPPPSVVNGQNTVTNSISGTRRFYRLN